ncbi:multidrug transporter [Paenibacillus swuensis]|uniref:Multidrug transporter n=2 Tax=Paenibacillus swuensis TaxID=1178515 RepID=A0A172TNN8_9BACL|nr:multidrug transporter [Paenibacillus swuensis]
MFILAVAIIAISFSSIFVKWSAAPVAIMAMYRLWMTNVLMLPFVWRKGSEMFTLGGKATGLLVGSGAALGLHFLLWMESLRYTSVASSTAFMALEPVMVMLGSYWAFQQRSSLSRIIGMAVAVVGAIAIGWGDWGLSPQALQGDLLSVLGTAAVALHMILGQSLRSKLSSVSYSFAVFAVAGGVLALYSLIQGYAFFGYKAVDWGVFALLAVVPTILGHYIFNWLLKYMDATSVSMSVLGEPIGATILAYFLLGEALTAIQLGAGVLLIGGVWLFIRSNGQQAVPHEVDAVTKESA